MTLHILGSSGFIGRRLYEYFLSENTCDVKGYSSSECNLLSKESVEENLIPNYDDKIIIASSITRLKENSLESMMKNITMTENITRLIEKKSVSQLIFLSTADVYGDKPPLPIEEKNLPNPTNYYSISKLASEFMLKTICSKRDIPLLTLRLPGVYGRGDEGKGTINTLVESAKRKKITIFGDGKDRRDFVYVMDICKIIKQGIENKINSTINVATGEDYSIKEITDMIKENFPFEIFVEYNLNLTEKRAKEIKFDTTLLRETFPNIKMKNLKEGLKLYLKD